MDRSYRGRRPQRRGGGAGGGGNRGGHQTKVLPPMHAYLDKHILVILSTGASSAPTPAPAQTKDAKQPAAHPPKLSGVLRGFDMYNNLVLENAVDESYPGIKTELGEIVRWLFQ